MKILLFAALFVFSFTTPAETIQLLKPVICDQTEVIFQALIQQGNEIPSWIGQGDRTDTSQTVLLVNEKTKSWTIVQFDKTRACVLATGVGSRPIFTGPVV